MMARSRSFVIAVLSFIAAQHGVCSSPSHIPPSVSPTLPPGRVPNSDALERSPVADASLTTSARGEAPKSSINNNPPRPKASSVTFLYELYEHEMYNPKTDSWTSRRFTQSPITGGGGRDSTSLDPQSCAPPRNYLFDGEWKIDMASESRDGFGWEYYVGKYDGLGRRRRRWVRSLRRVSSTVSLPVAEKKSSGKKKKKAMAPPKESKPYRPSSVLLRDQYKFKGFGWSFYKSCLFARSVGAAFRIPLSANFDSYDKYLAAPYISTSTYFGYPWVVATFLNASLPLEAIKWVIGGVMWKIHWGLAVASALIRGVVESVAWIVLWPWRLWRAWFQMVGLIASKLAPKKEEDESLQTFVAGSDGLVGGNATIIDSDGTEISIETHIQLSNSSEFKDKGETPTVSANAVVDSPRGGASANVTTQQKSSFRKRHLTISGKEIPTFHRRNTIEYSSTVQERVGICMSWRVSQERGYEYRWNFFYTCLPTVLFWGQLEEERRRRLEAVRRRFVGVWGKTSVPSEGDGKVDGKDSPTHSRSESRSKAPVPLSSFLSEHSSTVGMSAGWPLPVDPFFSLNLMVSMSGFYYGWLLRAIRSLFVLPLPSNKASVLSDAKSNQEPTARSSAESASQKASSEKIVSSALKKKLLLEEQPDDEACLVNSTAADVNVAGL